MARAGWFLWGKFRRRSRTRPPHRTHNCMCSQCPFVCNRELECWHNDQADRQRTDKRQCRKFLGDGFHGETSFRIFTKSVGLAHGNCKRFRTKPRFRSTKWSVRIKKCQEQAGPHIGHKSGVIALTKRRIHQGKRFRRMGKQFDARLDYGHMVSGYPSIFKCLYAFAVAILPREVRFKNPH